MWFFQPTGCSVFEISGRHAARYLQARLTLDVLGLSVGLSAPAAVLSPQGKVFGLLQVFKVSEESFLLWAESGAKEELASAILQFKVSELFDFKCISDEFTSVILPQSALSFVTNHAALSDFLNGELPGGHALILLRGADSAATTSNGVLNLSANVSLPALTLNQYHIERVRSDRVLFSEEVNSEHLLTEVPTNAYTLSFKGCYAGQEVIEKIHARGKSPFIIRSFTSQQEVRPGEALFDSSSNALGTALSSYSVPDESSVGQASPSYIGFVRIKNKGLLVCQTACRSQLDLNHQATP